MAFLRTIAFDAGPILRGDGIYLRLPTVQDFPAWVDLRGKSRNFLAPWEPTWPDDDLERSAYRRRIKRYQHELRNDHGYPFFLFRATDHVLLGGLTLSNVRRGVTQSCSLGYWMGKPFAGRGHMTAGVRAAIPYVFGTLRLHRLEAACLPSNAASIRLLEKAGFTREGYARQYLCIDGQWQDHLLYAIIAEDPLPLAPRVA